MTYTVVYDEGVVLNNNPISKRFTVAKISSENIMKILGGILLIFLL